MILGQKGKDINFTVISLQRRLMPTAFDKEMYIFYLTKDPVSDLPFKLEFVGVYKKFVQDNMKSVSWKRVKNE